METGKSEGCHINHKTGKTRISVIEKEERNLYLYAMV